MFSVNILLYGEYPKLASRCLNSIRNNTDWNLISEIRLGFNDICDETRKISFEFAESLPVICHIYEELYGRNALKYPMMRKMLHDVARPIFADNIMWFDDDSYISGDKMFWSEVNEALIRNTLVGSKYRSITGWQGNQVEGIKAQPWYAGRMINNLSVFMTGGWWACKKSLFTKWDFPFKEIKHNGGDIILGELCHQQVYLMHHFNKGIAINADDTGKESRAKRRGITTKLPWQDYIKDIKPDYSHHDFTVKVRTFIENKNDDITFENFNNLEIEDGHS